MTQRQWRFALMFLGVSLAYAPPAQAQRSGFIMGFGLGPGWSSYTSTPDRDNKFGWSWPRLVDGFGLEMELPRYRGHLGAAA